MESRSRRGGGGGEGGSGHRCVAPASLSEHWARQIHLRIRLKTANVWSRVLQVASALLLHHRTARLLVLSIKLEDSACCPHPNSSRAPHLQRKFMARSQIEAITLVPIVNSIELKVCIRRPAFPCGESRSFQYMGCKQGSVLYTYLREPGSAVGGGACTDSRLLNRISRPACQVIQPSIHPGLLNCYQAFPVKTKH